jgi:uncharacterized protein
MNQHTQPHTVWQSLALHLLPGVLITAFYFISAPIVMQAGYPPLMAILLAILFILIPFELGVLYYQASKQTGPISLNTVVLNRDILPVWQYFLLVPLLIGWSAFIFTSLPSLDRAIIQTFFTWLPSWSTQTMSMAALAQYPRPILLVTVIFAFAMNGIFGPLVEEMYFRGYLLPRIPASRMWAPLINVFLFSLYHFFSPWQNITRILVLIPMVYVVSWKRSIYLSILTHCLLNSLGMISMLSLLIAK